MVGRPATAVLTIEVDLQSAPISGRLFDQGRIERSFAGWVGLTHALNAALTDARDAIQANADDPPSGQPVPAHARHDQETR